MKRFFWFLRVFLWSRDDVNMRSRNVRRTGRRRELTTDERGCGGSGGMTGLIAGVKPLRARGARRTGPWRGMAGTILSYNICIYMYIFMNMISWGEMWLIGSRKSIGVLMDIYVRTRLYKRPGACTRSLASFIHGTADQAVGARSWLLSPENFTSTIIQITSAARPVQAPR